jgi:hypothetical protein
MIALNIGLAHAKPKVIVHTINSSRVLEKPVYIEVEKPVPVYQPVQTIEVEKPVYIEREIEVPIRLKDWDSLEQLEEFLKNDDTDQHIILTADSGGKVNFNGQCEDYALQLRDRAMTIGRYLSVEILDPKEYEKWYGLPLKSNDYHAICMARIGNEFWYIEPQTDKHWLALHLD